MFKSFRRIDTRMSGLNNMKARIGYMGGANQQDRMVADKLRSLRNSLLYSYQAATIVVRNTQDENGNIEAREFRALINPNKLTMEIDDKILSVPFEDICLNAPRVGTTTEGMVPIGVKVGDIIEWKDNGTHWIVYDQYLQETAYFRGQMRQCESEPVTIEGKQYFYYLKGPGEKGINWQKTKHFIFNELNYTVEMYISNTIETNQFFHRFAKLNLKVKKPNGEYEDRPFEVQAVDDLSTPGLLAVYLKEDYINEWAQNNDSIPPEETPEDAIDPSIAHIIGQDKVYPYDIITYTIANTSNGVWSLSNKRGVITEQSDTSVTVEITTGRSGDITLIYTKEDGVEIKKNISILSL